MGVSIDQAWNHCLPLEVDTPDVASGDGHLVAHGGEPAVLD